MAVVARWSSRSPAVPPRCRRPSEIGARQATLDGDAQILRRGAGAAAAFDEVGVEIGEVESQSSRSL